MRTKLRVLVGLVAIAAVALWLVGCDHYVCTSGATFGASSCTASGSGLGTTGPGGSATAAFVFAVDTVGGTSGTATNGTIDGFTLNTISNTLAPTSGFAAPTIPAGDVGAGMVVAQGKYLYAAFGQLNNKIYGWTISASGGLTPVANSPYTATFLQATDTGDVAQQSMITNPAGTLLFFADRLDEEIFVYQIGSGGALTAAGSVSTAGFRPLNLTTDGLGKYLYATNANAGNHTPGTEIAAFSINSATGALTPIGTIAASMWQVEGEPTGKFLVGTAGLSQGVNGSDELQLFLFNINQTTGALTEIAGPFPTQFSPFTIAAQPNANGNLVYSFGINDTATGFNPIEGFQIGSSGTLAELSNSPFSNVQLGSWGQFDQSGGLLLDYSTVITQGGALITQIGAFSLGSGGTLTQNVSPVTLVTPGYWAVTDAP